MYLFVGNLIGDIRCNFYDDDVIIANSSVCDVTCT